MCKRLTGFVPHLFPCSWQFTLTKHRHSDIHTPGLWLKDKRGVDENVGCVRLKFGGWLKGKLQQKSLAKREKHLANLSGMLFSLK